MRLPRDVSGEDLQQRLVRFGYRSFAKREVT